MIINQQYRVGKKLGYGNFGEIRAGKDDVHDKMVAIKLETLPCKNPQLHTEYQFYQEIQSEGTENGIPEVYYYGKSGNYNVLVMDLLGPSLEDLFELCGRKFSVITVANIAKQLIRRLETVHYHGIIHRDIKPENFLIGRPNSEFSNTIYIVDFGLSKNYIDPITHKHIPYKERNSLTGTARYMSINTHLGKEQSRRDDIEALTHMLIYFLRGSLPWQGLKAETLRERYSKICEVKKSTTIEALCRGFPNEFFSMLHYARQLPFEDTPDYNYLYGLMNSLVEFNVIELNFDWLALKQNDIFRKDSSSKYFPDVENNPKDRSHRHYSKYKNMDITGIDKTETKSPLQIPSKRITNDMTPIISDPNYNHHNKLENTCSLPVDVNKGKLRKKKSCRII